MVQRERSVETCGFRRDESDAMRLVLTILALIYTLIPYDLLPDFMIGWGWIDDIVILYFLWRFQPKVC